MCKGAISLVMGDHRLDELPDFRVVEKATHLAWRNTGASWNDVRNRQSSQLSAPGQIYTRCIRKFTRNFTREYNHYFWIASQKYRLTGTGNDVCKLFHPTVKYSNRAASIEPYSTRCGSAISPVSATPTFCRLVKLPRNDGRHVKWLPRTTRPAPQLGLSFPATSYLQGGQECPIHESHER